MAQVEGKAKRSAHSHSIQLSKPSTPYIGRFENSDVEVKLRQKYLFFIQDLIRIASTANTTLPLNTVDDRGVLISIQTFLKRSGPKYIFQFIQTNTENLSLVRSGFSLIIVCLTYLKRLQMELKLDETNIGSIDSKYQFLPQSQSNQHQHHLGMTNLQHKTALNHFLEEKTWVSQAVSKIYDSISVSSCMSIFVTTHDALAQELILNCVANMMQASDDAVVQMLTPPSIFNKSNRALDEKEKRQLLNGVKQRPHSRAATSDTMMSKSSSHLMGISSNNINGYNAEAAKASFRGENPGSRNRVSSSFSQIPTYNSNNNNDGNNNETNRNNLGTAGSGNSDERRNSATYNKDFNSSKSHNIDEGTMDPSQHSSLSYMFAVTVLQKNRHSLLAAAAEVIILMSKDASAGLCESIAQTPTCPLPLLSAVNTLSNNGGRRGRGGGGGGQGGNGASKRFSGASYDDETILMPINPLTVGKVVDWAGIKIFLKYLHRYHTLMATKDTFIDLLQQQHQLLVYEHPHEDKNMLTAMAMNNVTGLRVSLCSSNISRIGSPMLGSMPMVSGAEEGELVTSSKMLSEEMQRDFLLVHDRVFVALCFLIKGAPSIAPFLLSLPGAFDVLRLSNIIYHERKQDPSLLAAGAAFDMAASTSSASTVGPFAHPSTNIHHHQQQQQQQQQQQTEELEDAAVNIAMNTMQLEKQRQARRQRNGHLAFSSSSILSLDHLIYTATGGMLLPASNGNTQSLGQRFGLTLNLNDTGSMSNSSGGNNNNSGAMRTQSNPQPGQSNHHHQHQQAAAAAARRQTAPSPLARGFGNVKNHSGSGKKRTSTATGAARDRSNSSSSVHGKKLQPLGAPVSLSPVQVETLSTPITLAAADTHQKTPNVHQFETPPYPVQTETRALYKQNQLNKQQVAAAPASELQYLAVNRLVHSAQAPLQAPKSVDSLLDTSLQVIDREAKESVIHGQPQKERLLLLQQQPPAVSAAGTRHPLLTDSVLNFDPSQSSSYYGQSSSHTNSNNNNNQSTSDDQASPGAGGLRPFTTSSTSPLRRLGATTGTNMGATKDFFGALPHKPVIPKRIEAQDAIIPQESLDVIRRKFQQIAAGALNQIKNTGNVYNNGKNAVDLCERARRVYSPKRHSSSNSNNNSGGVSRPQLSAASPVLPVSRKQGSGLPPLSFLDDDDDDNDNDDNKGRRGEEDVRDQRRRTTRGHTAFGTDSPAAAAIERTHADTDSAAFDPEKTPAWNPRPEGLSYYGIRLDNVEFEEQDLFEHFKPIFDYAEHHSNVGDNDNDDDRKKQANADLYEKQHNPHGSFQATRGKIQGELEQTGDLLLL